jgi:two-component system response regulator HydG
MASNTDQPPQEAQPLAIRILIVDNDKAHAQAMVESLQRDGYECTKSTSGPAGKKQIQEGNYDIVITDLVMNEVDGMEVLSTAVEVLPDAQVVMVTGHASVPLAVEAMQLGAYNFLEKPITPRRLRAVVKRAVEAVLMRRDNLELNQRLDEKFGFEGIIFASEEMKQVIDQVRRVALTDATVLITGESGTGKELIAQAIHQNSPRKGKRLVPINCAAVAENLVESELFGHVKGAYTDAHADRTGAFEYAHGGSLFLDEVGDMPLATQIKLLRVLEDHSITRVGDNQPIHVNVRLISATNRSLEEAIADGNFREDLYYRLKVVTIALPSLKQRRDDIIPLIDHFRRSLASHHDKSIKTVTPAVTKKMYQHDWPGNVRQLRNTIESMVVLDIDGVLDMDDLPPDLADGEAVVSSSADGPVELIGQPLTEIEKWAYEQTLRLAGGNREEVARILGIGARTVYRKLKEYDL